MSLSFPLPRFTSLSWSKFLGKYLFKTFLSAIFYVCSNQQYSYKVQVVYNKQIRNLYRKQNQQNMQQSNSINNSLPQSFEERQNLKKQIFQFMERLHQQVEQQTKNENIKQIQRLNEKIETLQKRLKLIDKCQQFSLLRLNHLEEIFKYYCTHIFKIGKHMTFDRLQYEKQHLTIERLFLFLKDFQLTTMTIEGKQKEVLSKNTIITIFKKTSSTSRDLSFQEFIKCIQKIAIAFYDQKENYYVKIQQQKLERIRRKKQFQKKKVKRMKLNGQKVDEKQLQQIEKLEQEQKNIDQQIQIEKQEEEPKQNKQPQQFNNENDDLIKQLMENKDLQDPNEQVNKITNKTKEEIQKIQSKKKIQKQHEAKLIKFTNNQKIQYFYELINVDSLSDYKNKLTKLNMTVFQKKNIQKQNQKNSQQNSKASIQNSMSLGQDERIMKLKQKMNQKKQKQKAVPIPKPKEQKETQTARKRRQMKQERQLRMKQKKLQSDQLLQKKKDSQKKNTVKAPTASQQNGPVARKSEFNQKQVNWNMLQKMNFQQLKLRQFNPTKLYSMDQDDNIFMQEYGGGYPRNNRQKRANSRLQVRQRQSLSVVQNVKKRVDQMQKVQKNQQNNLNKKLGSVKGKF